MGGHKPLPPQQRQRPRFDLGAIFRRFKDRLLVERTLSPEQSKVMGAIEACRTSALGGHLYACTTCEASVQAYNSCRNRHCPKCQGAAQYQWVEARKERLLNTRYFHVVFTIPAELRELAWRNQKEVYDLIIKSAAQTLLKLGQDERRLGGLVGITTVLHTWTRSLAYHPHVHCIVTGGGLMPDGKKWRRGRRNHLFPVRVLAQLFRGKVLDGLKKMKAAGQLDLGAHQQSFDALVRTMYKARWVAYAKAPFGGPTQVFRYLGQYTHRVGLANSRIQEVTDDAVVFRTRGQQTVRLAPEEFLRRFLMHVLPPGFMKIRHYGLWASACLKTAFAQAKTLIGGAIIEPEEDGPTDDALPEPRAIALGSVVAVLAQFGAAPCPYCHFGLLVKHASATGPP